MRASYITARDIVIPAGTEVDVEPSGMQRTIHCPFAHIMVAETADHTSAWSMPLDEALTLGIVAEAKAA